MKSILLTINALFLLLSMTKAQEIKNNLFYSCENCKITNIYSFGENKVLFYHDGTSDNDYIYLLNSNNLFIDTLKVASANGKMIKLSNNEFIALDLNIPTQVKIINNKLKVSSKRIFTTYQFKDKYDECDLILDGKYMIGRTTLILNGEKVYDIGLLSTDISTAELKEMSKIQKAQHGYILDETYYILDYKNRRKNKLNTNLKVDTIIDYKLTLPERSNCTYIGNYNIFKDSYYFGFFSYYFSDKYIYYFNMRDQTLYTIERKPLKLKTYFRLPIDNPDKNAWKHYYDYENNKHYFLRMVKNFDETIKSKKEQFEKTTFTFELYEYNKNENDLVYRCSIDYIPNTISNECLYKIIEKKNGTDILKTKISDIITNSIHKLKISNEVIIE